MTTKPKPREAGNAAKKRTPSAFNLDARLRRYLDERWIPGLDGDVSLETAEGYLYICAENESPLPGKYVRAIAAEYFRRRKKQLDTLAKRAERDRIAWTAAAAALNRGYGTGIEPGQCFYAAAKLIDKPGLSPETIKERCYTIVREKRRVRIDHELLNKFLAAQLSEPPKRSR